MTQITCTVTCPPLIGPDTLDVLEVDGHEEANSPFAWTISGTPRDLSNRSLSASSLLGKPCTLDVKKGNGRMIRHGYVDAATEGVREDGLPILAIRICPRVQRLAYIRENRMYLDQPVQVVLMQLLRNIGLQGPENAYFALGSTQARREFTWQFEENALEFMNRLCREEGISWFTFDKGGKDLLVFADDMSKPIVSPRPVLLLNLQEAGDVDASGDFFFSRFMMGMDSMAARLHYQGTHLPDPPAARDVTWNLSPGDGAYVVQGERYASPEEALRKSVLRKEALNCQRLHVTGDGWAPIEPGRTFSLNVKGAPPFALTMAQEVQRAREEAASSQGQKPTRRALRQASGEAKLPNGQESKPVAAVAGAQPDSPERYLVTNLTVSMKCGPDKVWSIGTTLKAIPMAMPFRPMFQQGAGRLRGPVLARVHGPADGELATMDEHGRYKVVFSEELSGRPDQCSVWLPLVQPFGGRNHGMHLPLRKNADVLLVGHQGNHEDLMILGALPTLENPSLVRGDSQRAALIRNPGGAELQLYDSPAAASATLSALARSGLSLFSNGIRAAWATAGSASYIGLGCADLVDGFSTSMVAGHRTEGTVGGLLQVNAGSFARYGQGTWTEIQERGERIRICGDHNLEWDGQRSVLASQRLSLSVLPQGRGKRALEGQILDSVCRKVREATFALKVESPSTMPITLAGWMTRLADPKGLPPLMDGRQEGEALRNLAQSALRDLAAQAGQAGLPTQQGQGSQTGGPGFARPPHGEARGGTQSERSERAVPPRSYQGSPLEASSGDPTHPQAHPLTGDLAKPASQPPAQGPAPMEMSPASSRADRSKTQPRGQTLQTELAAEAPPVLPAGGMAQSPALPLPDRSAFTILGPDPYTPGGSLRGASLPRVPLFSPPAPSFSMISQSAPSGPDAAASRTGAAAASGNGIQPGPTGSYRPISTLRMDDRGAVDLLGTWITLRARNPQEFGPGDHASEGPGLHLSAAGPIILGEEAGASLADGQDEGALLRREMAQEPTPRIEIRARRQVQVDTEQLDLGGQRVVVGGVTLASGQPGPCDALGLQARRIQVEGETLQVNSQRDLHADLGGGLQVLAKGDADLNVQRDFRVWSEHCQVLALRRLSLVGEEILVNGRVLKLG